MKRFIVAVLILSLCTPCLAATQLKKTVKPSGGDYTSLEACMNDNEQNLVTADKYFDVEIDGSWSSADTSAVTIHNYTTDSTRYINIYTIGDARHDGREASVSGRSNYIIGSISGSQAISAYVDYTTIDGLEIANVSQSYTNSSGINIADYVDYIYIVNTIIHDIGLGSDRGGWGIYCGSSHGSYHYYYNNIIYLTRSVGIYGAYYADKIYAHNNTIFAFSKTGVTGSGISCSGSSSKSQFKNNLIIASGGTGNCLSVGSNTVATNGTSDTTGTSGLQNLTTSEFVNVSAGSEDLHLASGATSIGAGTDLSGTFTTDIDGDTRSSWDIGADEYVPSVVYTTIKGSTLYGATIK